MSEGPSSIRNPSQVHRPKHTQAHALVVAPPVYLWLIVQPEDQVGEQLEQVLPQQQRHVKVNVAYVRLAHVSSVAHVAHAHKLVDQVVAVAPVLAGVGLALVQLLLAPAGTEEEPEQLSGPFPDGAPSEFSGCAFSVDRCTNLLLGSTAGGMTVSRSCCHGNRAARVELASTVT